MKPPENGAVADIKEAHRTCPNCLRWAKVYPGYKCDMAVLLNALAESERISNILREQRNKAEDAIGRVQMLIAWPADPEALIYCRTIEAAIKGKK